MASSLPPDVLADIQEVFNEFDADSNGHITTVELGTIFQQLGESVPGYKLRELISQVDADNNGTVEFDEFVQMYMAVSSKGVFGQWKSMVKERTGVNVLGTASATVDGTKHSYSDSEQIAFAGWINSQLAEDPDCTKHLPINGSEELFLKLRDGVILCKMINLSVPKTIDERAINTGKLNAFLITENCSLAVNSANSIGCSVVNIGHGDISSGKPHLMLSLLWQIIRIGLFAKIKLSANPNIAALLLEGETIQDLMQLSPEELLLRWMNYHLARAGSNLTIKNFGSDITDSVAYAYLLHQIAPPDAKTDRHEAVLALSDETKRAELVLRNADKMGCRRFLMPKDIVGGNSKLNMAFVANLFNTYPCLELTEELEEELPYEETREEKTYRNWMNSLGVSPFVYHLYNNLNNGLVLFQLYEDIKYKTVDWERVNKVFKSMGGNMKRIENCNYALALGKTKGYSLIGIGGEDIYNGTTTLVLALVWQMLRDYTLSMLSKLAEEDGTIKDSQIVDWVNQKLEEGSKPSRIKSFKDPSICNSLAIIDLVDVLKPGSVDYSLVKEGNADEDKELNAQYAITMTRKIGARTYALPEDIVEVKPKMVLTVFACLMTHGLKS